MGCVYVGGGGETGKTDAWTNGHKKESLELRMWLRGGFFWHAPLDMAFHLKSDGRNLREW